MSAPPANVSVPPSATRATLPPDALGAVLPTACEVALASITAPDATSTSTPWISTEPPPSAALASSLPCTVTAPASLSSTR